MSSSSVPLPASLPLLVGVSTRALFQLEEENRIFETEGWIAYEELQLEREQVVLEPGAAFDVVRRLLALNDKTGCDNVEVILLSKNSPNLSLRALNSAEKLGIQVRRGSFTSGRAVAPYVDAWGIDLFLSNDDSDVRAAVGGGTAAARLGQHRPASATYLMTRSGSPLMAMPWSSARNQTRFTPIRDWRPSLSMSAVTRRCR